jgi:hypothetical protein
MGRIILFAVAAVMLLLLIFVVSPREAAYDSTPVSGIAAVPKPSGCEVSNLKDPYGRPYYIPSACSKAEIPDYQAAKLVRAGRGYIWLRIEGDAVDAACDKKGCKVFSVIKYKFR